jgi:hypothetical protein
LDLAVSKDLRGDRLSLHDTPNLRPVVHHLRGRDPCHRRVGFLARLPVAARGYPWPGGYDAPVTANWGQFQSLRGVRRIPDDVVLDFGAGPRTYRPTTKVLNLRPDADGRDPIPADGPVDWLQLDKLSNLLTVEYAGPSRGIVDVLAARPGVRFLYWDDAVGDIDLRATGVRSLRIGGPGLRSVAVPERLDSLQLRRAPSAVRVEATDAGHDLRLQLFPYSSDAVIPSGLRRTRDLWLRVGGEVSVSVLSDLTDLEMLVLDFDQPSGNLTDAAELARHTRLRVLKIHNAYGPVIEALPDLPALRELELGGTRMSTAATANERYRYTSVTVNVWRAKTDEWLAAHMNNPFRDWIDDGEAFAQAACEAYDRARVAIGAITPANPDRLAIAEAALRGLIADLNAVDSQFGEIDTNYREQVGEAFHRLARGIDIPGDLERQWFDEGRLF